MGSIVVFGLSDLDDGGAVNTTFLAFCRFHFVLGRVAATPESEQTKKSFPSWLVIVWFMRPCLDHLSCDAYDAIFFDIAAKSFSKQRGLARFPSSCLLHPADAMAMYSCLTCCGISSMSFGSLMNDRKKGPPPQVGMYSRKEHLLHELRKRDVKLVTPQVFFDFWKRQEPLPRCQDVPREYFLNIDKISEAQAEKLEVVAVSYCWIDSSHPDPQCYHLRTLCGLLEKFVTGTFIATKTYTSMGKTFVANGNEVLGSGDGRPVGLFLDWMSAPQELRNDADARVFERALRSINLWYAHSATTTWMLTSLPSGVTRANYGDSGWTTFERQVAGLISPSAQLLEISSDVRDKLFAGGFRSDDYYQVSLNTMDKLRGAPVNPKSFAVNARKEAFHERCGL